MKYNIVFVNGQAFNCYQSMCLKDLLIYLNFDTNLVAVEYNKEIINSSFFDAVILKSQDCIEVITIAGGG
uniref:Thiamine biosynthesis protein S n=1 Tax=Sebdenia flabellata TaxID=42024 RepID=A0A1C9CA27_9FLOR|nr:hypothetical protein Sebd_153 [Sebdenia flabellata]AOM65240.1 hypothetical protein Sebd_153 [Sebdenia flabellata]